MRTLKALVVTSILALPLVAAAAPPTGGDAPAAKPAKTHKVKSTKKKATTAPAPTTATPAPAPAAPPASK